MSNTSKLLKYFPPMGVYETLFKFQDATNVYMGEAGTFPWAQGFPLTTQLPNGPELPTSVEFGSLDLKYPQATGNPELLEAIARYYNHFYGANITAENVCVFAGGRPGIFASVAFLPKEYEILIEETEYTPYFDLLELLERKYSIISSNEKNAFAPTPDDYAKAAKGIAKPFFIKSNPCNPTGQVWNGEKLKTFVEGAIERGEAALFDEAYELFNAAGAESALRYIPNIDETNLLVVGAATKGLQVPGMRTGWVIAAKETIEIFRNFSSIAMGGVSRPSQICVSKMLEIDRVTKARMAVKEFYDDQRRWYGDKLSELGIKLFTGEGGFYHWGKLPGDLTADEFNERLFKHKAAILPGHLCDMKRRGAEGEMGRFIRFSFGPLLKETREESIRILSECL